MAGIDYHAIKTELKDILEQNVFKYPFVVAIEGDIILDSIDTVINIELVSRSVDNRTIAAGKRVRYIVDILLTVWVRNWEREQGIIIRDKLLSEIETLIMQNRSINGAAETSYLDGGQNIVAFVEDQGAYIAAGELIVKADCLISL